MTASKKLIQASAGVGGGSFYPYTVDNSCRFNDNDSAYLTRTPGSAGDSRVLWTMSFWCKRGNIGTSQQIASAGTSGTNDTFIYFLADDTFGIGNRTSSTLDTWKTSTAVFRDPSAWYHFVVRWDTANGTAADRVKIWVNNEEITAWTNDNNSSASEASHWNNNVVHDIGRSVSSSQYCDLYLSQFAFCDGQSYSPSDFGEDKNGIWVPKNVSGLTFGTNGFYLDFSNSADLGNDVSGNNNDFTSSGLATNDQVPDTPTNTFATINPLAYRQGVTRDTVYSEGNTQTTTGNSQEHYGWGLPRSGAWYWEVSSPNLGTTGYRMKLGVSKVSMGPSDNTKTVQLYSDGFAATRSGDVLKYNSEVKSGNGSTTGNVSANDIVGLCYDADNLTLDFFINGISYYQVTGLDDVPHHIYGASDGTPSTAQDTILNWNFGQNGDFNGQHTAQGNADENGHGDFYYTPPSGALAICTANFPEPAIGPNSDIKPEDCFATVLYTGNGTAIGSGGKVITGVGFQPDMVVIKNRDAADSWMVFDSVRGATKYWEWDSTDDEATSTESLTSFDADGFTLGNHVAVNTNTEDYVAYCFKITAGFFDIQTYVGTGVAKTETHSLTTVPNFMMVKNLDNGAGYSTDVYYSSFPVSDPETDIMLLDASNAISDQPAWNDTAPTSSVFSVGAWNATNGNTDNHVAYLFANVPGFCKIGYYEGNGSADGPFQYLGFSSNYHLVKRTDAAANWIQVDSKRAKSLFPDLANSESAGDHAFNMLSNGIKNREVSAARNANGGDYITLSIGITDKYSNAR